MSVQAPPDAELETGLKASCLFQKWFRKTQVGKA